MVSFYTHSNWCQGKNGLVWIEPLFCSALCCPARHLYTAQRCWIQSYFCGFWLRSKVRLSGISPFSVWLVLQTHAQPVTTHSLTHNAKSSHVVTHVPSLCVSHVDTHNIFQLTNIFFLTRQWRSELTSYFCVERNDCWGAEGESKLSVSVTSKAVELRKLVAFKNSNGDILHFCKLARHSEIVPLINSLKLWVMKSTGSFGRTQTLPPLKLSNLCTY